MKFSVIGTGVIGALRARSVVENPDTQLLAVADVNEASAKAVAAQCGARAETDYRRLLDEPGLEAVIVSSPVHLHEEMCTAAFERGLHVLVEKPLSNNSAAARRILEAAARAGRTLSVGFNHRYYPSIAFLKERIDDGTIGTLDHVRVFGGHDGLSNFRSEWMYKGALSGGGAMMDCGIHMTDLARFVAGEVTTVFGTATNRIWNVEGSEDNALAVFRTESGVPVHYQATWDEWRGYHFYVDAYGDKGMVRAYYAPMFNLLVTQAKPGGPRQKRRLFYPEIILREKFKGWQTTSYLTFVAELRDFLLRIGGRDDVHLADGWSGVRSIEIAEGVYESQRTGRSVDLPAR